MSEMITGAFDGLSEAEFDCEVDRLADQLRQCRSELTRLGEAIEQLVAELGLELGGEELRR